LENQNKKFTSFFNNNGTSDTFALAKAVNNIEVLKKDVDLLRKRVKILENELKKRGSNG